MNTSPASRARARAGSASGSSADRIPEAPGVNTVPGSVPLAPHPLLAVPLVVGVNGSAGSAAALRWAADEACRRHAMLRIVSAWQADPEGAAPGEAERIAHLRVGKALARVFRRPRFPGQITCATPRGMPGRVLLQEAGLTELLVLGLMPAPSTRGPGPTGRYCLRHRRGPLVFVPAWLTR